MVPPALDREPTARCDDCGFEWYGRIAAHALATVGGCIRCGGSLSFSGDPAEADDLTSEEAPNVSAHLALGRPRR